MDEESRKEAILEILRAIEILRTGVVATYGGDYALIWVPDDRSTPAAFAAMDGAGWQFVCVVSPGHLMFRKAR